MDKSQHSTATMYAILKKNARIAHEASMTGALDESTKTLISAYNRIIKALREMECLDELLFEEASPEVTMDEIGVLSAHLAEFFTVQFGCGKLDEPERKGGMADFREMFDFFKSQGWTPDKGWPGEPEKES